MNDEPTIHYSDRPDFRVSDGPDPVVLPRTGDSVVGVLPGAATSLAIPTHLGRFAEADTADTVAWSQASPPARVPSGTLMHGRR